MTKVDIKLLIGYVAGAGNNRKTVYTFPVHQPVMLNYFMGFKLSADYLIYEVAFLEEYRVFDRAEVFTFNVTPQNGTSFTFVGRLYNSQPQAEDRIQKMHFVSQYYPKLQSMIPLYGSGNISDLLKAFYAKAGVPKFEADLAEASLDNVLIGRDQTIDQGISYLLDRATASDNGFLYAAIVNDKCFIRNLKKGKQDYAGIFYTVQDIYDARKEVDSDGGLSVGVISDATSQVEIELKMPIGKSEVTRKDFYTYESSEMSKNRAAVKQRKTYYNNYTAIISMPLWAVLMGSNLVVDDRDIYQGKISGRKQLMRGKYFVNSALFEASFSKNMEAARYTIQLVDDA
jgi:hypothetical protein